MTKHKEINSISLKQYAEESYLNYAMYVILDRALPNIGDGLKPVSYTHLTLPTNRCV